MMSLLLPAEREEERGEKSLQQELVAQVYLHLPQHFPLDVKGG